MMRLRGLVFVVVSSVALLAPAGAWADAGCANESLRQGPSAMLPDCRAYELVTPAYKQGEFAEPLGVSTDGSRMIVQSFGNFGDAQNSPREATYELTRGASGWTEEAIDPPAAQFPWDHYLDATPDLRSSLFELRAASQSLFNFDFWMRDADGSLHDLGQALPPAETAGPAGLGAPEGDVGSISYTGASRDFSKVLFSSRLGRWPGDTSVRGEQSLYEYSAGRSGPPELVGVDDGGNLIGECGVYLGTAGERNSPGAVSADGSKVFFTVTGADEIPAQPCSLREPVVGEVFTRVDESSTVAISEPSPNELCTSPSCVGAPPADAEFMAASVDGSKVFFASTQQLMDGASEDGSVEDSATRGGCQATSGAGGCNLYEYDFQNPLGRRLVLVSAGATEPRVQGVAGVSEDGSHVYFVAKSVLTQSANQYGAFAVAGGENLYVFERDAQFPAGRTLFVATLSPEDAYVWGGPGEASAATATPDGRFLVFPSIADITPDDTSSVTQLFRYDAQTGGLVRVSIGQGGFNLNGNTDTFPIATAAASLTGKLERGPSAISDDGAYVVFQSADGLTPGALNAQVTNEPEVFAQNVYEYHDGSVQLISDGQDAASTEQQSSVRMLGTVGLGGDVFFQTADPLVQQDGDTQLDIYDAHVNGGFAPEQAPVGCQGDVCQGLPAGAPALVGAGSSSFSGPGNLSPVNTASKARPKVKPKKHRRKQPRRRRKHTRKARRAGGSK